MTITMSKTRVHRLCAGMIACGTLVPLSSARADEGGAWIPLPRMQQSRQETGAARIGDVVYVSGGLIPGGLTATDTVEALDLTTGVWSSIAPMPEPRDHHGVVALNGLLYVIGGYDANFNDPRDTMWIYDPGDNTWTDDGPNLPARRGGLWAVTHEDGNIYVFGGEDENRVARDSAFCFDPVSNTWSEVAPMPTPREHLTAVSVGPFIYVIGGRGAGSTPVNERYDPATNTWTTLAPMPTSRSAMGVAALGDRIFVFGGETPRLFAETEIYHIPTDTWTCQTDMVVPRHGLPAIAVPEQNAIVLPAGGTIQGLRPSDVVDAFSPGPTLRIDGPCPGEIDINVVGASPGGQVALVYALARGTFAIPNGRPCAGVVTALDGNTIALGGVVTADGNGEASIMTAAPAQACGVVVVQAIDLQRCLIGNIAEIQP